MISVRFGNLTVEAFEKKTEVTFSDEDRKWLNEHRTDNASDERNDVFHIFDMPLGIACGFDIYKELVAILMKYDFKKQFYAEQKEADIAPAS